MAARLDASLNKTATRDFCGNRGPSAPCPVATATGLVAQDDTSMHMTSGAKRTFGELGSMKRYRAILLVLFVLFAIAGMSAQDWIRTGTGLGVEKVRLAVPDFKQVTTDTGTQNLSAVFNVTLWNDLQSAGIFDMVSKSFYPL